MSGKLKPWTAAELAELRRHCAANQLYMKEIAEKLGRTPASVRYKGHQLGIFSKPEKFAQWNSKHVHLREPVLRFYLTHSFEQTAEHFGLTLSEMKSCLTGGYKEEHLKHLRKEWRPHTPWTDEEWRFMVAHVGVQPREWIGKKLKRGNTYNSVKDALAKFRGKGKYFNGMPWGWAEAIFGSEAEDLTIRTKAGPTGRSHRGGDFRYRILPWADAERLLDQGKTRPMPGKGRWKKARRPTRRIEVKPELEAAIRAMAKFQRWIHGKQSARGVRSNIQAALRRK